MKIICLFFLFCFFFFGKWSDRLCPRVEHERMWCTCTPAPRPKRNFGLTDSPESSGRFFFINDIVFKLFKFNLKKFKIGSLKKNFELKRDIFGWNWFAYSNEPAIKFLFYCESVTAVKIKMRRRVSRKRLSQRLGRRLTSPTDGQ